MVEAHARRFDGRHGAEFDDLKQEGLIAVWKSIQGGYFPANIVVQDAMRMWVRKCASQNWSSPAHEKTDLLHTDDPKNAGLLAGLNGSPI